jgi:hypothetical protein
MVGSEGGRQADAHHMFDVESAFQSRSNTTRRNRIMARSWPGSTRVEVRRLVAQVFG